MYLNAVSRNYTAYCYILKENSFKIRLVAIKLPVKEFAQECTGAGETAGKGLDNLIILSLHLLHFVRSINRVE